MTRKKKQIDEQIQGSNRSRPGSAMASFEQPNEPWMEPWDDFKSDAQEPSSGSIMKIVLHRNGFCLFLRNEQGLDLPGGHMERDDFTKIEALRREVLEETGLTLSTDDRDIVELFGLELAHPRKHYYVGPLPGGKCHASGEHIGGCEEVRLEDVENRDDISAEYKEVIRKVLNTTVDRSGDDLQPFAPGVGLMGKR